jgi:hypothetical protein
MVITNHNAIEPQHFALKCQPILRRRRAVGTHQTLTGSGRHFVNPPVYVNPITPESSNAVRRGVNPNSNAIGF